MEVPRQILLIGGSRGIGLAVAKHLAQQGDELVCVSRSPSPWGRWVPADIGKREGIEKVCAAIGDAPLDCLLYLGGIWELNAFTEDYRFEESSADEIDAVIRVNLMAPVLLTKALLPNLRRGANSKIIYMGSLSGLEHCASAEVANSASKYGLRGAAQALRHSLKREGIGITVINPGNVAIEEVNRDIADGLVPPQTPIPLVDVLRTIDYVLQTSRLTCVSEINLAQQF
jgi:3-oxoacyl-[acyl-carrier protein] reductase